MILEIPRLSRNRDVVPLWTVRLMHLVTRLSHQLKSCLPHLLAYQDPLPDPTLSFMVFKHLEHKHLENKTAFV